MGLRFTVDQCRALLEAAFEHSMLSFPPTKFYPTGKQGSH